MTRSGDQLVRSGERNGLAEFRRCLGRFSVTRPTIPGGLLASRARVRFTGERILGTSFLDVKKFLGLLATLSASLAGRGELAISLGQDRFRAAFQLRLGRHIVQRAAHTYLVVAGASGSDLKGVLPKSRITCSRVVAGFMPAFCGCSGAKRAGVNPAATFGQDALNI